MYICLSSHSTISRSLPTPRIPQIPSYTTPSLSHPSILNTTQYASPALHHLFPLLLCQPNPQQLTTPTANPPTTNNRCTTHSPSSLSSPALQASPQPSPFPSPATTPATRTPRPSAARRETHPGSSDRFCTSPPMYGLLEKTFWTSSMEDRSVECRERSAFDYCGFDGRD